ncbi:serine protease HTRA3-like [Lampris incognitus]|uniref:serine protease HTRA3-like n=1 Tax=Lampris incognitus TaxID=2546036 RepID=UPI0024B4E5C8|nr:serine protease HTRA3-like [Lampris incognitus]
MQLVLFAVLAFLALDDVIGATSRPSKCPSRCDVSKCPSPRCPGGYVPDRCRCCLLCAAGDGEPCGRTAHLPCGDGLECKPVEGSWRGAKAKGVCRCKAGHRVCGSDGKTYGSVCKMRAASRAALQEGRPEVTQAHKGPCPLSDTGLSPVHPNSPRYKFNFIANVVERIAPAVVHIELFLRHPLFGHHLPLSSGSGFIVTHSGLIVTNAHVVTTASAVSGQPQLRVQLHNGNVYDAVVRDVDRKSDIATIKVNSQKKLPVLTLGRSADLRPGEFVVAIGSPFALQNTVTTGIVSTAQRDGKELGIRDSDMDYIQTDAIINYGNSGGPLVNLDGEVIGINTLKVTAGISFAIPSDRISHFLTDSRIEHSKDKARRHRGLNRVSEELQSDREGSGLRRRFLGIRMLTITDTLIEELKFENPDFPDVRSGVLVRQVIPDSPADKSGMKAGDVIVKLNGQFLWTTEDLQAALLGNQPVLLEVRRGKDDLLFNIHPHTAMH